MFKHQIDEVKKYFRAHFLNAKEDWLEECIEWAMHNHPPTEQTISKLQNFAYQQWLLADLREVGCGCLPSNLAEQKVVILPGNYTVQAERVLDIANSMYSQVKAIRGGAVEVEETPGEGEPGDEDELTEWGRAPKNATTKLRARKLQLYICDGKEELYAFEYRPLPQLKGMILPGVKLLVSGPVECRRGVLLLEPRHLKVLGGELDVLIVPNAPENYMARTLGLPENPEPYKDVQSTVGEVPRGEAGGCAVPMVRPPAARVGPQQHEHRGVVPQPARPASTLSSGRTPASKSASSHQVSSCAQADDVDSMDDFDLTEEDLLALEMESSRVLSSSGPAAPLQPVVTRAPPTMHQAADKRLAPVAPYNPIQDQAEIEEDYLEVDLDELESQVFASNPPLAQPYPTNSRPTVNANRQNSLVNDYNFSNVASGKRQAVQRINSNSIQAKSSPRQLTIGAEAKLAKQGLALTTNNQTNGHQNVNAGDNFDEFEDEEDIWDENQTMIDNYQKVSSSNNKRSEICASVKSPPLSNAARGKTSSSKLCGSYKADYGSKVSTENQSAKTLHSSLQVSSSGQQKSSVVLAHPFQQISRQSSNKTSSHNGSSFSLAEVSQPPLKKLKGGQSDIRSFTSTKKCETSVYSPARDQPNTSPVQSSKPNLSKFMNSISKSEVTKRKCVAKTASCVSEWPFVYLCQVQEECSRPRTAVVKACVVTLLQKLTSEAGQWGLELRLADGSANLNVLFSSKILESIIGFSVAEFITIKQMAKGNPIQKEKLVEGLQGLKQKLIDLNCLMKIDFAPGETPCVVELEAITTEHMKELQARRRSKTRS